MSHSPWHATQWPAMQETLWTAVEPKRIKHALEVATHRLCNSDICCFHLQDLLSNMKQMDRRLQQYEVRCQMKSREFTIFELKSVQGNRESWKALRPSILHSQRRSTTSRSNFRLK